MEKVVRILEHASAKDAYNAFVEAHELGSIHQSWEWGEFQSKSAARDKFWPIVIEEDGRIIASALIIRQKLPAGRCWLYCPRGPLVDYSSDNFSFLCGKVREIARREKAVFWRIDPALPADTRVFNGFYSAHAHYQPENTLMVDLNNSEENIMAQMKPKGRYNIRLAEKKGVTVAASKHPEEDIEYFYRLLTDTTSRDGFSGHDKEYYRQMLKILGPEKVRLYLADYEGDVIAATIVTFFRDTAIYYFGASGNMHRNVMAPYLLQWEAMQDARKMGLKWYDFLGIAPENNPRHAWAGVTQFKLKFGGEQFDYMPAQERVFRPLEYSAIRLLKWVRRLMP